MIGAKRTAARAAAIVCATGLATAVLFTACSDTGSGSPSIVVTAGGNEGLWWTTTSILEPPPTPITDPPSTNDTTTTTTATTTTAPSNQRTLVAPSDVLFEVDSDYIDPNSTIVTDAVDFIMSAAQPVVELRCFADAAGTPQHNADLTTRRAQNLRDALRHSGVPDSVPMTATGMNSTDRFGDNSTPTGRALNRRCEVSVTDTAANS